MCKLAQAETYIVSWTNSPPLTTSMSSKLPKILRSDKRLRPKISHPRGESSYYLTRNGPRHRQCFSLELGCWASYLYSVFFRVGRDCARQCLLIQKQQHIGETAVGFKPARKRRSESICGERLHRTNTKQETKKTKKYIMVYICESPV